MAKEYDLPQELIDRIVDELQTDRLISHIYTEGSPIPPLVRSLHIYPFNPPLNDILPLLQNVSHLHLQTDSLALYHLTADARILSSYPLTTLRMGKPLNLLPGTYMWYHYSAFFHFVRCLPQMIEYVSLHDVYIWDRPSAEDTSTIKGPSLGTLNLRTTLRNQSIFYPNQSGINKLCIDSTCLHHSEFTSLDCLQVPSVSIWIDVFMYGTHALKLIIEKLESIPLKSSLQNLQIILAFRLSGLLQYVLERPSSDELWQSLAEHAHKVGSREIIIMNAVPYSGTSFQEWDILVSRWTTKLGGGGGGILVRQAAR
ncbi:hypothetical protein F5146DRAFT_1201923 [Armillaria mellea]|nr:hypothetical protein F5146DRAFT_1201923 [Armillaria mellea]